MHLKKIVILGLTIYLITLSLLLGQQNLSREEQSWLKQSFRSEKNGWIYLHIEGPPFQRGFQHGYLLAKEIAEFLRVEKHMCWWNTGKKFDFFVTHTLDMFKDKIEPEYQQEMKGIAAGAAKAGIQVNYEDIVYLNANIEIMGYWYPWYKDHNSQPAKTGGCSAFIATGKSTADNGIVMVHNTWTHFVFANCYVILDLLPENGSRILMQAYPGAIHSGMDFFITSAGILGTETTIEGFKGFDPLGAPEFTRIRKTMQYAKNIDDCCKIMIEKNNGGYANTWLFGDINTGEIARLELGLKNHKIERTTDGFYTGSNITRDIRILRDETKDDYDDIRNSNIARRVRWKQLFAQYNGKINIKTAQIMLGDHYDVYLNKELPNSRSICGHGELDPANIPSSWAKPFYPLGSIDAKVVDSKLAREMKFWAKWGSSCNIPFDASKFLKEHQQYDYLEGFLKDRPNQQWTLFSIKK